jgi:predicted nucleic acid-binding protein
MNGSNVLIDSNIILYLLNGDRILSELLYQKKLYISFVSQLELLGYRGITLKEQGEVSKFIKECIVIDINEEPIN